MKRDCGEGELIPIKWEVVSVAGASDKETVIGNMTKDKALETFEIKKAQLRDVQYSDVRLYALDKKGYANCMKSWFQSGRETDRMAELN